MVPRRDVRASVTKSVASQNWNVHAGALAVVGLAWLAIFWTHPDRQGLNGLGDGLLVFVSGAIALGYAVLSSVAMLLLQRRPRAAWMVHGGTVVVTMGTLAALFMVR
jgi:hypothetical protein